MTKSTPQVEWIRRKGILLWLAFFLIELGAGLYFISIFFNNHWGMFIGWLICLILGGGFHLLFLGKPLRFYRIFLSTTSLRTSWITRGLYFISIFAAIGAVHLALIFWAPDLNLLPLQVIIGIVCFLVVIYGGFAMNYVSAIPLWNTGLLPALYCAAGFWGGAELLLGIMLATGVGIENVETWSRVLSIGFVFILVVYLWSVRYSRYSAATGEESIRRFFKGDLAPLFYLGVVAIGLAVPIVVMSYSYSMGVVSTPSALFILGIAGGLIGDLSMRYCILRGGMYAPLVPAAGV